MFISVSKRQLISHDEQLSFQLVMFKPGFQQLGHAEEATARNSVRIVGGRNSQQSVFFFAATNLSHLAVSATLFIL